MKQAEVHYHKKRQIMNYSLLLISVFFLMLAFILAAKFKAGVHTNLKIRKPGLVFSF